MLAFTTKENNTDLLKEYYETRDEDLCAELVERNRGLVGYILKKTSIGNMHIYEDLFSCGMHGLLKAVRKFNPYMGVQFSSYASRCIHNEMYLLLKHEKKHTKGIVSFEAETIQGEIGKPFAFEDFLTCEEDYTEVFSKDIIDLLEEVLQRNTKQVVCRSAQAAIEYIRLEMLYRLYGGPEPIQMEVAKRHNISQSVVSRKVRHIRESFKRLWFHRKEVI